jgi:hypothetical protein
MKNVNICLSYNVTFYFIGVGELKPSMGEITGAE